VTLTAATLLLPGLTACGPQGAAEPRSSGSAAPDIPTDAKEALLASTEEISKGNFTFTMTGSGLDGTGTVHQPSQSAKMSMKAGDADQGFSMGMEIIYVEPDSWVKINVDGAEGLPGLEKLNTGKYQHLDQSKMTGTKGLGFDFKAVDPAGSAALTKAVVDVRKTGEGSYSGTIDLTRATDAGMVDADAIKAIGPDAAKLPFEAKLDEQGRLASMTIKMPAVSGGKAHELTVAYSEYGTASPATAPPAAETVEAPAELYKLFNN